MKRIFLVSMVVLTLLTLVTVGTPIAAAQNQAVEPAAGAAGTTFTFHIGGFTRGERVAYWLNTPNSTILAIGDRGTNASGGKILVNWESHAGIPLGFWQFVARGVDSGVQKVVTFEVTGGGNALAPGASNVIPPVGSTGTTFTFYASGFTAGETGRLLAEPTPQALGSRLTISNITRIAMVNLARLGWHQLRSHQAHGSLWHKVPKAACSKSFHFRSNRM